MSTSPASTPPYDAIFVCDCEVFMRGACLHEKFYEVHTGKRYCVLHYPGTEKKEDFEKALQRKLDNQDFDFRGVWFPDEVSFDSFTFSAVADFTGAHFSAAADFVSTRFNEDANFNNAQFNAVAYFIGVQFSADANFSAAQFNNDASFVDAQFNKAAYFTNAQFRAAAIFYVARFSEKVNFDNVQFSAIADFRGVQFNEEASFVSTRFNEDANFRSAKFNAYASFSGAEFSAVANFARTRFNAYVDFNSARFNAVAYFSGAQFSENAMFDYAVFNVTVSFEGASFIEEDSSRGNNTISNNKPTGTRDAVKAKAKIIEVIFTAASFKDGVIFERNEFAEQAFISFAAAIFEKPERAVFHTSPLRPHWFINVDSRKFTFIDVSWGLLDKRDAVRKEMAALESSRRGRLSGLLEVTFRQLAVNAEENNRYEEAANFRYMAMEVRRLQRGRKVDLFRLSWWYWLLSGYGERVTRAFGALLTIWLLFAFVYWLGDATWWQPKQSSTSTTAQSIEQGKPLVISAAPLTIPEALIYSAGVMTLQKPEPLPANKRAKALVLFETILGPLQAALLALAIRRKFMR